MEWHGVEGDVTEHEQCMGIRNHGDGISSDGMVVQLLV
jgi:hypothetical protein